MQANIELLASPVGGTRGGYDCVEREMICAAKTLLTMDKYYHSQEDFVS